MTAMDTRVRSVLDAPRGHRFSRPGATRNHSEPRQVAPESHQARRARLLRQMEGNPRVEYMLQHGELPHWMTVAQQRCEQVEREARQLEQAWREAHAQLETEPAHGVRRGRHRAPRRWQDWPALAVSSVLLFGQAFVEAVGEGISLSGGSLI